MLFEDEINEDLLTIPDTEPMLTRQHGFSNLLALISLDTEVNFDKYVFKCMSNFDDLTNSMTKNLPKIKRHKSDSKHKTKSPNVKRINTF